MEGLSKIRLHVLVFSIGFALLGAMPNLHAESSLEEIKKLIDKRLPGVTVDHIAPSPIEGVLEVGVALSSTSLLERTSPSGCWPGDVPQR